MGNLVIKNPHSLHKRESNPLETRLSTMIAQRQSAEQYSLLLCDVSGSMKEIARGEHKIDTLARTVNNLVCKGLCKLIAFSDAARNVKSLDPVAGGITNMAAALSLARQHRKASQIIIISDGHPNEPEKTLAIAQTLLPPISCIYVGPGEDEGFLFLQQLARMGRGQATYTGEEPKELQRQIQLMLSQ